MRLSSPFWKGKYGPYVLFSLLLEINTRVSQRKQTELCPSSRKYYEQHDLSTT